MMEAVWEFRVASERAAEFEATYDSEGDWAVLFRNDANYRGTTLLRDREDKQRYLTIDRWESEESYRSFKERFAEAYKALDERCEALTESERLIGIFESSRDRG